MSEAVLTTALERVPKVRTGKVRDVYDLGESLLIVTTDRISAFDVVMPNGIPDKGRVLTQMTLFWLGHFGDLVANHLITAEVDEMPTAVRDDPQAELLRGRSMLVRKAKVAPVECIARGYLVGSGWAEYRRNGSVCGHRLPSGLEQASKLPKPLFTPSTKADEGHDMNITRDQMAEIVGAERSKKLEELTLALYSNAADYASERGIIIADTKFEFGTVGREVILIDEVLTPDSSRFWPAEAWKTGANPPSFDKQYLRDYLETLDWKKEPPGPELPAEVIERTRAKYVEALERLTGKGLEG
jgi:phosphoribosylaminoimidazole-succinocarboxamide synthase